MPQICSKMVIFLFSAYFGYHFCYHSNRKSQINTRPLHFGYCSNKQIGKTCKEQLLFFDLIRGRGQNSLLMHIPLCEEKNLHVHVSFMSNMVIRKGNEASKFVIYV